MQRHGRFWLGMVSQCFFFAAFHGTLGLNEWTPLRYAAHGAALGVLFILAYGAWYALSHLEWKK